MSDQGEGTAEVRARERAERLLSQWARVLKSAGVYFLVRDMLAANEEAHVARLKEARFERDSYVSAHAEAVEQRNAAIQRAERAEAERDRARREGREEALREAMERARWYIGESGRDTGFSRAAALVVSDIERLAASPPGERGGKT